MATVAASLCYFPSSLRKRNPRAASGGLVKLSSWQARSTARMVAPLRDAEPVASLGDLTRVEFPILH
ncbi:hypothetical protein ABZP36_031720 [Zizania latifolia]